MPHIHRSRLRAATSHGRRRHARWACGLAACALALTACGGAATPKPRHVELPDIAEFDADEPAIVHESYRFRLASPGPQWSLLEGSAARAMHPDISAMALLPGIGANVQVLVEQADISLKDAAMLHTAALELAPQSRTEQRTRHQGLDALEVGGIRTHEGAEFAIRSLLIVHAGHLYELRAVVPRSDGAPPIEQVYAAAKTRFALLSGAVKTPTDLQIALEDTAGPGWRVEDGVYESSISSLRVEAPAGWRLLLGDELAEYNPDAEVGLLRADPAMFALVVPERVGSAQLNELEAFVRTQSVPMHGGKRLSLQLAGGKLELTQISAEGLPESILVFHATHFRDERLYQFVVGFPAGAGAEQHVQPALDAFRFLDRGARRALEQELAARPDTQAAVAGDQALWGGRFRDFERGITWAKPSAEWDASIGDAASEYADEAILAFEHARTGIMGYLLPMDGVELDARALLRLFLSEMVSEGRAQQIPIRAMDLDGADSSASCELDADTDGMQFRFAVAAVVVRGRAMLLTVSGLRENMSAAPDAVRAALAGLAVAPGPLPPHADQEGAFVNWRYGYRFTPPSGAKRNQHQPPAHTRAEVFAWNSGKEMLSLTAIARGGAGQRVPEMLRLIVRRQVKQMGGARGEPLPEPVAHPLASRPGHRVTLERGTMRMDIFAASRGSQIFVLTIVQAGEARSAARAEEIAAGLQLLE